MKWLFMKQYKSLIRHNFRYHFSKQCSLLFKLFCFLPICSLAVRVSSGMYQNNIIDVKKRLYCVGYIKIIGTNQKCHSGLFALNNPKSGLPTAPGPQTSRGHKNSATCKLNANKCIMTWCCVPVTNCSVKTLTGLVYVVLTWSQTFDCV